MGDGFSFDFDEVTKLAADLGRAPAKAAPKIIAAVEATAIAVRDDWREPLSGSEHVPGGAGTVTHELRGAASAITGMSAVTAEIGPVLRGQGPLVGMLEYGTPKTGARGFGAEALFRNQQKFEDAINEAGEIEL
ncbi:hypothetical protein [Agromyces sp. CF514]|uniref:hypothetical protein n=1 Tax=Agromyces sp. CF514 TaxID=1881031 RepID=UPI000B839210|nr:hypothetical protein [Agromyces sp. CF514]